WCDRAAACGAWSYVASTWSVTVPVTEVGRLVVLAGGALDLLLLGEEALQFGIGLLHQGGGRLGGLVVGRGLGLGLGGTAACGGGGHDLAGLALTGGLPHGHGGLGADLVLEHGLVGQDVALVDPD